MKSAPSISVVVPLFNKSAYIRRCLCSIRQQTMENFEAIIVDDGSTDGSSEIASSSVDDRFRIIRQPNGGPGAARNRGIAAAQAPLVAFLDADDEWDAGFLEAILQLAREYPQAGMLGTGSRRLLDTGHIRETSLGKPAAGTAKLVNNYFRLVRDAEFITASSVAIPMAVLERVGTFPERQRLGEDGDLWARIAVRYPVGYDVRVLATYHSEAQGRACQQFASQPPFPPLLAGLRKLLDTPGLEPAVRNDIELYIEHRLLQYAYTLVAVGDSTGLRTFLSTEPFRGPRYRAEAMALRIASPFVPARFIQAIKVRSARAGVYLRQARLTRALVGEADGISERLSTTNMNSPAPRLGADFST